MSLDSVANKLIDSSKMYFWENLDYSRLIANAISRLDEKASEGLDFDVYKIGNYCVKFAKETTFKNLNEKASFVEMISRLEKLCLDYFPPVHASFVDLPGRNEPEIALIMPWMELKRNIAFKGNIEKCFRDSLLKHGYVLMDFCQVGLIDNKPYVYDLSSLKKV